MQIIHYEIKDFKNDHINSILIMVDCCSLGKSALYLDRFVNLIKKNNKALHNRNSTYFSFYDSNLDFLYPDNRIIIAESTGFVIRIDSPIVCWLAAPFKKLSCVITELLYCPLPSRSVPGSINRGCSARHFHLVN